MLTKCLNMPSRFKFCNGHASFPYIMLSSSDNEFLSIENESHNALFCFILISCFLLFFCQKKLNTFTLCAIERKCEKWNVSLSYFLT